MKRIMFAVGIGLAVAFAIPAAPAHADDDSFLAYLDSHGFSSVNVGPMGPLFARFMLPGHKIQNGHQICDALHIGDSREAIRVHTYYALDPDNYNILADAAQHELCPDTLG